MRITRIPTVFPPVAKLTRRRLLAGAGALGVLTALSACGSREEAAAPAAPTEDTFPVTIAHKYGSTQIPRVPERVVSVGDTDQDPILALGVTPIAVRDWFGDQPNSMWPWARDELGNATPEVLPPAPELDFEQVARLRPDVIIGTFSSMTGNEYKTLAQIAPTVAQSGEYPDYGQPWQEITQVVGRALGREERAKKLVAEVEAQFEAARRAHPEFEGTSAVVGSADAGTYAAYTRTDTASRFLVALGFEIPPEIEELAAATGDQGRVDVSEERLDLFDTDLLVWYEAVDEGHGLLNKPLYTRLDVHKEGRDIFLGYVPLGGALAFSTVLSLPFALDRLVPMLTAAVDGDPTTKVTPGS